MSIPKRSTARAIITLKLEVNVPAGWGPNCTIEQAHDQATESAMATIRKALAEELRGGNVKMFPEPDNTVVVITKQ